ncbi:MAG: tetratricopeptide repeat protein [bacterium]|nr:tetratricopeptide repeat protein [bacterium]
MKSFFFIIFAWLFVACLSSCGNEDKDLSTKSERNAIVEGNQYFHDGKFSDAEAAYKKALTDNPNSQMAAFNLATTFLRQAPELKNDSFPNPQQQGGDGKEPQLSQQLNSAIEILQNLAQNSPNPAIVSLAAYDLGNIAYRQQNYPQAIECYKEALRKQPKFNDARYNLRMAQLKNKDNQKNQNKNQDKNKDQQQDKDKNKEKDKDKDKNKDKNQDQQQQNQNKDKNQQQQNQQQQNQQQNKGSMSGQNMDQILRSMQNQENATQQRVNAARAKQQAGERARTQNKW